MKIVIEKQGECLYRKIYHSKLNNIDKLTEVTIALSLLRDERDKLINSMAANDDKSNTYFRVNDG